MHISSYDISNCCTYPPSLIPCHLAIYLKEKEVHFKMFSSAVNKPNAREENDDYDDGDGGGMSLVHNFMVLHP
jgi:hypothetical protein